MHRALLEHLEEVQLRTFAAIAGGNDAVFFPTLTLCSAEKTEISVMADSASTTSEDFLAEIEQFGYAVGHKKQIPDFIFFAAESVGNRGDEIMVSGCSKEFELIVSYLALERDGRGMIRPTIWRETGDVAEPQSIKVPAFRAMRGAMAKANAPWWKR